MKYKDLRDFIDTLMSAFWVQLKTFSIVTMSDLNEQVDAILTPPMRK